METRRSHAGEACSECCATSRSASTLHSPLLALLLLLSGCAPSPLRPASSVSPTQAQQNAALTFTDVTQEVGIRFQHVNGATGQFYYPETFGSGAAFLDYDRDGWLDILLVNGDYWPGHTPPGAVRPTLALYHNAQNGRFSEVTAQAGLRVSLYGMGAAVGDYDNDGYDDLYITGLDHSLLFHNAGDGRFVDVTRQAGVGNEGRWGTSAAWLDYDNDSRLDLFVCNYVRWQPEQEQVCRQGSLRVYCGPLVYPADSCRLFRNLGGGRFRDVTQEAGIFKTSGKALGVAVWDIDGDRYPDILVANDLTPNYLFHNHRDGTFREVALEAGVAYGADGTARSGMGIDVADTRNDGRCAIFISNFAREPNSLFSQEGPRTFSDKTYETGMGEPSLPSLGFGLFFFDYDNDGWKDAFVTNGHIQPEIARYEPGQTHAQKPLLFRNRHDGHFEETGQQVGGALREEMVGRGAACGDYDNDGDLDILVTANDGPAKLLRNDGGSRNAWLTVRLIGRRSNRNGIGAEVRVRVGGRTLRDQVRSGSSYLSASDLRLHFGLGAAKQADWVEVRWPDGAIDRCQGVKANRLLVVEEGRGAGSVRGKEGLAKVAHALMIDILIGWMMLSLVGAAFADAPLTLEWRDNRLTLLSPRLPGGRVEIWYLEAFCRTGSTHRAWEETVIPHRTVRLDGSGPTQRIRLKTTVEGGVEVVHDLRVGRDGVRFDLRLTNRSGEAVDIEWAQPCIQVAGFTGRTQETYLDRCFIFTDRPANHGLTRLNEIPRSEEGYYRGGQVYVPAEVNRADVNPRPLSPVTPSNGLIGCFSADNTQILAMAWDQTQELFQGIITCIHADFRIGGLRPGETRRLRGRLYLIENDIPRLLRLYRRDFPASSQSTRATQVSERQER